MRRKIITINIIFFTKLLFGQQDLAASSPNGISNTATPNVAGFMRFQESSVNHYNGRGNFSIPIYEINVGGIKYPISLNYAHGGIQVNSIASDVGLGWSLTSTFINRTIVGDADLETINDTRQLNQKKKYGYFDYKRIWGDGGYGITEPNVDFYPDLFKFVSPNGISRFYFNGSNSVELDKKGTYIGASHDGANYNYLKDYNGEWFNNLINVEDYNEFELVTKDGISYTFREKDLSHSFAAIYSELNTHEFGGISGTYPRASSWYVSQIKNLHNNEELVFTYETYYPVNSYKYGDILNNHPYFRYETFFPSATVNPAENNLYFREPYDQSNSGRFYNRLLEAQRLKKIKFRGGSVEFEYNKIREDQTNGRALTSIVVKNDNGVEIKKIDFDYDYFVSNTTINQDEFNKRLKLLSVKEDGKNEYQFDYYEEGKLPRIGSVLQDVFGYNNDDGSNPEPSNLQYPLYYYYPNKYEYSLLPYDIDSDNNHYPLIDPWSSPGIINKEPNDLSKLWSLKKVKFPSGGSNTYVLESNTFNLWGNNLKGGGVRLKQQIIKESEGGQERVINYNYNKDAANTSGYLFNMPEMGYPASILTNTELQSPWLKKYFVFFSSAKVNYDLVNNFFIGYSKVEENEDGIKTVYEFANEDQPNVATRSHIAYKYLTQFGMHPISEFLIKNSAYGNNIYIDNSHKRGKLRYIHQYDKSGYKKLLKENVYSSYNITDMNNLPNEFYSFGSSTYTNPNGPFYATSELMQAKKSYNAIYNNLVYTKTTNYFPSGNIEDESYRYFDNINQNLIATAHKVGNGVTYPIIDIQKFYYPSDLQNGNPSTVTPAEQLQADDLLDIYKNNTPMLTQSYSGEIDPANISYIASSKMTSQVKAVFSKDNNTSGMIMPTQVLTAMGQNSFYEVGKFDRYDSKGNLLQTTKDGFSTTYLYGYNQLYPIAKIEGATYDQVMSALGVTTPTNSSYLSLDIVTKSNADIDESTETNLITALDSFRKHVNLANYRVTTYTYNPLIGVTSVTPPSGMREVYIYEPITNKLQEVKRMEKDAGGNDVYRTLKEYEYHYKP